MCEQCEDIDIYIADPLHKSNIKYDTALEVLEKALGYSKASGAIEISPYRSVRDLIDKTKGDVEKRLLELHNAILSRWLRLEKASSPFKLSGKIVINPRTGKPLTKAQWKIIKKDLMRSFAYVYGSKDIDIARTAMALGKIVADLPVSSAIGLTLGGIKLGQGLRVLDTDPQYRASVEFAEEQAAEDIVDLSQKQYKKFHDTVVTAQKNRVTPRKLETELFQTFGDMNRDWRRIAETEIGNNMNNGKLITELNKERVDGDYVFMRGMSSPMACPWCRESVYMQIVVVLEEAPTGTGDQIDIDGKTYTAIWPGKTNVGRGRRSWWVASGTQHPHCQCTFVRYLPGYEEEFSALETAIEEASEEARNNIISYVRD